ncbi:hypothetical protein N7534_005442 [Penicillium rubens]|nr:hypothetical protein N7534_005442 [Penicillium rubens]
MTNSTQNETPGWVTPVATAGSGLLGLCLILGLIFWAVRYLVLNLTSVTCPFPIYIRDNQRLAFEPQALLSTPGSEAGSDTAYASKPASDTHGNKPENVGDVLSDKGKDKAKAKGSETRHAPDSPSLWNSLVLPPWVRVPHGYRLPPKRKQAYALGRAIDAFKDWVGK